MTDPRQGTQMGGKADIQDQDVPRRGTFDGLKIYVPGTGADISSSQMTASSVTTTAYETAPSGPPSGVATPELTPRKPASPMPSLQRSTERPLPPLPDGASVMSLGLESILGAGPRSPSVNENGSDSYTRSNSSDSRAVPTTPRTMQYAPSSPIVHGHGIDGDGSSIGSHPGLASETKRRSIIQRPRNKAAAAIQMDGEEEEAFSVSRPPSKRKLWEAGTHFVRDEDGRLIYFGDLFPKWDQDNTQPLKSHTKAEAASMASTASLHSPSMPSSSAVESKSATVTTSDPSRPPPKTVIFFIRNFWCGQCQDYMFASICLLDPEAIRKANIRIAIISTGSYKFIKKYRKLTKCPFPIYVDGGEKLYNLLG